MELDFEKHVRNFISRFENLSALDKEFLESLARFGGACSRKDASIAMGFSQIYQVNSLLDRLTRQRFLTRKLCNGIEGYPVIYFVSSSLAQHLKSGWYRFDGVRDALIRSFRFSIYLKNRERTLWSFRNGASASPASPSTYHYLRNNMIDSPISCDSKTMLVECLPFQSFQNLIKKLTTLKALEPALKFELWSPCQTHLDRLNSSLPDAIKQNISAFIHHHDPLYAGYAKSIEDSKYSQFNFDDTEGVFA